ncbi:MAG TPA: FemAB family PEP-CTERM system-associated protein [Gammaproteobacteria bacterium]|nr:FemAB family PEP-CTERM system-associated protein [Gammaproteobacteria bacterium]
MQGTGLEVVPLAKVGRAAWNAFVEGHDAGTFFHLAEWQQLIEEVHGHATKFLAATRSGVIEGVLPLAEVRSRLFGHALVSLPFCVYGGTLARTEEARAALEAHAVALAHQRGVDYLELRFREGARDDWPGKDLYVTFRKRIDDDPDVNMKAIPRKQRAMVRKGIEAGLLAERDCDIERFFPIYAASVRDHGTPVFARRHFARLLELFGDRVSVMTVTDAAGGPLASVLSFHFRDEVLPYYGGGLPAARASKAFDFMYWSVMCRAAEAGARIFDYGRSKQGTGSFSFKRNWGFEPVPLPYRYHLVHASSVPDVNPLNPKYRLFIAAWQKLPLPVANFIGPWLARSLG